MSILDYLTSLYSFVHTRCMFDHLMGLLLLGLGINKSMFDPAGSVKGDQTVASASATSDHAGTTFSADAAKRYLPTVDPIDRYYLDPHAFATKSPDLRGGKVGSGSGKFRPAFDTRAFGVAVMTTQADFAQRVEASRAAAIQVFQDHKAAFQQELSRIKDTRKQGIVDKINTDCQNVNQKRTDAMTAMLAKLSTILTNVSNRSASAAASGKDTTNVDTAVATAQSAIADAQTLVAAQAGAICTITITSDATVKTDVNHGISTLQQALSSIYQKVLLARKAVSDAIHALALVTGENLTSITSEKPATSSGGRK